uniref:Uncharacterized protein n=1 Tax=Noccaea caerulescens TaxID=107243 RepID=A0A1J3CPX4_NOCCA
MELVSGKVVPGCSNADNPFHECTSLCIQRLNSGNVQMKEKKLFGFGKITPSRDTPPGSPAPGSRSPLHSYFARKKVETENSPSSNDHTNGNFFSRLSPIDGRPSQLKNEPANNVDSLPMSPSLAGYAGGDYFATRNDQRGGEDDDMSPRPFGAQPKTPEHPLRTPQNRPRALQHRSDNSPWPHQDDHIPLAARPRTPEQRSNNSDTRRRTPIHDSAATGRRPQTREERPMTAQNRGRSPEFMARSPGPRSKTPEPQPTYFEPLSRTPKLRSKTPEPSPRIPQTQPISHRSLDSAALQTPQTVETRPKIHESRPNNVVYRGKSPDHHIHRAKDSQTQQTSFKMGQISSQAYSYLGNKAESFYIDKDDESVVLYPELILSPQERPLSRPITPSRRGYETPTKQEEYFDHLDELASSDDDKFSFVDDHDDNSVWFYPEITPKSGSNTPIHHKSGKSPSEQDKQNKEPPELSHESQGFSLSEISRMKGIVVKKNETRDETTSTLSESYVSVGDYKVRASVSATLELILEKHGDIASASKLHSLATRSYYLDMLASVVFELQNTPLKHLKETRAVEMLATVKDVESVKIKASWLKPVLEEIVEAVKHYDQHKMSISEKEVWEGDVLLASQEMEKQWKELRENENKLKEWRERTTEMAGKMGNLDMRRARLDKRLAFLSSKVDKFQGKSLLQGIL